MKRRGFLALLASVPVVGRFLDAAPVAAAPLALAPIPDVAASPPAETLTESRRATAYVTYADAEGRAYRKAVDVNVANRDGYRLVEVEIPRGARLMEVSLANPLPLPVVFTLRAVDVDVMHFAVGARRAMHWAAWS